MLKKTYASVLLASSLMFSGIPVFADQQRAGEPKPVQMAPMTISPMTVSTGLQTTSLSSTLTPTQLVQSLLGGGVTVSNVHYTGANVAAGTFTGGDGIIGFNDGIVLSTGKIENVKGPNSVDDVTEVNNTPGDLDLNYLIPGHPLYDAAVLEFDFIPDHDTISFQYVFASDEYNEFVNSPYNDGFAFFVNGVNKALIPNTNIPVSINNVNGGNPYDGSPAHNSEYYINNSGQGSANLNTEMDGLTKVLYVEAPVNRGQINHIKLVIADAGDQRYDSNVFIKAGSLTDKPADTVAPVTHYTLTPIYQTVNGTNSYIKGLNFGASATDDNSGVDKTEYRINSGAWTQYSNPFSIFAGQTHKLEYFSTDKAGNKEVPNVMDFDHGTFTGTQN